MRFSSCSLRRRRAWRRAWRCSRQSGRGPGPAASRSGCGWGCIPVRRPGRPPAWWAWTSIALPGWRRSPTGARSCSRRQRRPWSASRCRRAQALRDLGVHRLKDLGRPERIFQLDAAGLQAEFPPLRSLGHPALQNNLPAQLATFIGRERELSAVRALVGSSRLVTLTGAGGAGKTRLSLQVAAELLDGSGDGVWLVELAAVSDEDEVAAAISEVLRDRRAGRAKPALEAPARCARPAGCPDRAGQLRASDRSMREDG